MFRISFIIFIVLALNIINGDDKINEFVNNQENIANPSGLCAERVALFHAGAQIPGITVDLICIVAKGDLMPISQLLSPCGACRQVMLESENRQNKPIRIILVNQDNRTMCIDSVQNLLPFGFGTFQ
jgi:cytidine deaminase